MTDTNKQKGIFNSRPIPKILNVEAFLSMISIQSLTECWVWTGKKRGGRGGYGAFVISKKQYLSHRVSYSIFKNDINPGLVIDHMCKNESCVNPEHLREVTVGFNSTMNSSSFSAVNLSKTHCPQGHEYSGENLMLENIKNGRKGRKCKTCFKVTQKRYRDKLKQLKTEG